MDKEQLLEQLRGFFDRHNCNVQIIEYNEKEGEVKLFAKLGKYEIHNDELIYEGLGPIGDRKERIKIRISEKGVEYLTTRKHYAAK